MNIFEAIGGTPRPNRMTNKYRDLKTLQEVSRNEIAFKIASRSL